MFTKHSFTVDLHTHSILSKDGGITEVEYCKAVFEGNLDYVAITDHDQVDFALSMHKKLGEKIIVGEEIRSAEGEVIGLFLSEQVLPDLSLRETVREIQKQNGLVYLPHPFCHGRFGVSEEAVLPLVDQIDIVEQFNPRNIVHSDNATAEAFARKYNKPMAASSDSHCVGELGRTYTVVSEKPTRKNLLALLSDASLVCSYTTPWHLLCPKKNSLKKILGLQYNKNT